MVIYYETKEEVMAAVYACEDALSGPVTPEHPEDDGDCECPYCEAGRKLADVYNLLRNAGPPPGGA